MRLVNDIYFVPPFCRRVLDLLYDPADIIYAGIGCSIDLHHIHEIACHDRLAVFAFVAGFSIHRMQAVDRFGKDFCHAGLAGSSGSGEQIGMPRTVIFDLVCKSQNHVVLSLHLTKSLRSEFSVQSHVRH